MILKYLPLYILRLYVELFYSWSSLINFTVIMLVLMMTEFTRSSDQNS
jgi:hypothetical protein